uniref:Uncharacterized protein n=1 Tax=Brassica campestris TaxID=3711 RepID=M4D1A6_BRACM
MGQTGLNRSTNWFRIRSPKRAVSCSRFTKPLHGSREVQRLGLPAPCSHSRARYVPSDGTKSLQHPLWATLNSQRCGPVAASVRYLELRVHLLRVVSVVFWLELVLCNSRRAPIPSLSALAGDKPAPSQLLTLLAVKRDLLNSRRSSLQASSSLAHDLSISAQCSPIQAAVFWVDLTLRRPAQPRVLHIHREIKARIHLSFSNHFASVEPQILHCRAPSSP